MTTCTKKFGPYPFAHRQPLHTGHCSKVHGHNFYFEMTFAATELDANGFVQDFGRLGYLKEWLADQFDHTLVVLASDPLLAQFQNLEQLQACYLTVVNDGSAEGLAAYVYAQASSIMRELSSGRVSLVRVTCFEDEKNSATYEP